MEQRQTATLLVEGGGFRGAFGAGVLAELHAASVRFDEVVAVSAGAPTAVYLCAGQMDDAVRIWEHHTHGAQLVSPANLLRGAPLMDIDRLIHVFERVIPLDTRSFSASSARCWIVVTNCHTGRPEHIRATPENVLGLVRATMALPVVYGKVVTVGGVPYVDGGVTDAVPVRRAVALGRDKTVLVLTQPQGYRRSPNRLVSGLIAQMYPFYPALRRAIVRRWRDLNEALDRVDALEREGAISVIRPSRPLPASRLTTRRDDILATLAAGREAAQAWLRRER
jgi:predicted patatin/cPLA2 family phospholipase